MCAAFASASDALREMAEAPPPDALITDIMMPDDIDGLDLLRAIRSDPHLCGVPVVMLTARGMTPDRIAGYEAGCSAYITKPFDPEELVAVIRALTSNALLARSALLGNEVATLRAEVAQMRGLIQSMVQLQRIQTAALEQQQQQQQQQQQDESGGGVGADEAPAEGATAGAPRQLSAAAAPPPLAPDPGGASSSTLSPTERAESDLAARLAPFLEDGATAGGGGGEGATPLGVDSRLTHPSLTRRERSVLELVGEGALNKEIASQLGVGLRYVEKVVKRLLEKTGTPNRTALVRKALQTGLISLDGPSVGPAGRSDVFVTRPPPDVK